MLENTERKHYVVYRYSNESGRLYQCHRQTWERWENLNNIENKTKVLENVTQTEARGFCKLTREE